MFIYKNTIYYSNSLNPDSTQFELPKGAQALTSDEEKYVESITMENILNGEIQDKYKVIIEKLYPGKIGSNKNK